MAASICGTDGDVQNLEKQKAILREADVFVLPSSNQAAAFCRDLLQLAEER